MSDPSDQSRRGSNPTLVESNENSPHHVSYRKDLESGRVTNEKDHNHHDQPTPLKRSGTAASAALEAAMTGEATVENLDISPEEKARLDADPNVVDWEPNDPLNPQNWSNKKKWQSMGSVALMTFVSPFASTLPSPALPKIAEDFGITNSSVVALCLSIFILGYAFGPLIASPASELYGRAPVYRVFFFIFFAFNVGAALATNTTQFIVCRFFAGVGGSAPITVSSGTAVDLFDASKRGMALTMVSMGPLLGPIIAPVISGFMAERTSVAWLLWLLAILSGVVALSTLVILRETNPEVILKKKVGMMRRETGNDKLISIYEAANGSKTPKEIFVTNMSRAIILFFTDPICALVGIYMAICYGYLYLFFTTFGQIFTVQYGHSIETSGLHYIAPGLGNLFGAMIAGIAMDKVYLALSARNGGVGKPEFRVPIMIFSSICMPAGLFIYGWCAEYHTHWIALDIGGFIFGFGVLTAFLALNTYLLDAFKYAASAVAATTVIRSIAGALFPLFGEALYKALGNGWGNSLLGFIALALGSTYPIFLWYYGPAIRARAKESR